MLSWLLSCVSAGIGSDGQFAPIRLSCEILSSSFGSLFGVVEFVAPSMVAVKLAARRVNITSTFGKEWRGVLL